MRFWKTRKVNGDPRVGLAIAAFQPGKDERRLSAMFCLLWSIKAQTWKNWRLLVVHDGPLSSELQGQITAVDPRIGVAEREPRGAYGHPHRQWAIDSLATDCDWIGLTNDDNYYAPTYFEWLLSIGTAKSGKDQCEFVYADMVHSHKQWKYMNTQPRRGGLDLGCWLARRSLALSAKFDNFGFAGDGDYINRIVAHARKRSKHAVQKVPATLFVHN